MISPRLAIAATILTIAVAVPSAVAAAGAGASAPVKGTHACASTQLTRADSKPACKAN